MFLSRGRTGDTGVRVAVRRVVACYGPPRSRGGSSGTLPVTPGVGLLAAGAMFGLLHSLFSGMGGLIYSGVGAPYATVRVGTMAVVAIVVS